MRAWDITRRLRLGASDDKGDHWFRYEKRGLFSSGDRFELAALEVVPYLGSQAESWWKEAHEKKTSA